MQRQQQLLIQQLDAANQQLVSDKQQLEIEYEKLKEQNSELLHENVQHQNTINAFEDEIQSANEVIQTATVQNQNLQSELQQRLNEIQRLRQDLEQKSHAKQAADRALERTVLKLADKQNNQKRTESVEDDSVLRKKMRMLEEENLAQRQLIADYERAAQQHTEALKQAELRTFDRESELLMLRQQLEAEQNCIIDIKTQYQELHDKYMEQTTSNSQSVAVSDLNQPIGKIRQLSCEKQFLELQLKQAELGTATKQQHIEELQQTVNDLKGQNMVKQNEVLLLRQQNGQLQQDLSLKERQLAMEINVLNHQIANLEKINDKFASQSQPQVQDLVGQYKNFVIDMHDKMEKQNRTQRDDNQKPQQTATHRDNHTDNILLQEIKNLKEINLNYVAEVRELMLKNQALAKVNQNIVVQLEEIDAQRQQIERFKGELVTKDQQIDQMINKMDNSSKRYQLKMKQMKNEYDQNIKQFQQLLRQKYQGASKLAIKEQNELTAELKQLLLQPKKVPEPIPVNVENLQKYEDVLRKK